jgi:hypothetical protein
VQTKETSRTSIGHLKVICVSVNLQGHNQKEFLEHLALKADANTVLLQTLDHCCYFQWIARFQLGENAYFNQLVVTEKEKFD